MTSYSNRLSICLLAVWLTSAATLVPSAKAAEYETLFNGIDLAGWKGLEGHWSVVDGAIVGETTKEKSLSGNSFLIWQGGKVADFEFTASVRFKGNNSGVQYRSQLVDEPQLALMGYQMDLHPSRDLFGMLYGEKYDGRGKIATRGQKIEISPDGKITSLGKVGGDETFSDWQWNQVRIIAVGNHLIHQINGVTTIDVTDRHSAALAEGLLGLQIHRGPPMRVEFKELKLRRLSEATGKSMLDSLVDVAPPKKQAVAPEPNAAATVAAKKKGSGGQRKVDTDMALSGLTIAKDFKVEVVHVVDADSEGSWVSLTIDDQGRFIASDQGKQGIFRVTLTDGKPIVEKLPTGLSGAQGLLWKDNSLFASITGEGLYRVIDSNGAEKADQAELLSAYFGKGEHGNHALVDTEQGPQLYAVSGNHTPLPTADSITRRRVQSWQEDLLLPRLWDPRGHARGVLAPGGWVTRFDPATKSHDVYCIGFRNQYDVAANEHGDLFTYDADMEWDLGLPWYRPTRICHVVSGGDFGWRSGSGKWRPYFEDSLPPLVDIGPGSPTGMVSGRGTHFPAKYQRAIYALDWTYGRILAIHAKPQGAGYVGTAESFVSGKALPVTDAVVGKDGALYFTTGGRGAKSALMRIVYTGEKSTSPAKPIELPQEANVRRQLEVFHGVVNEKAIEQSWPHLASDDRFLRNAARVAIESQPVNSWAAKVFSESNSQARITAAVALARMGMAKHQAPLLSCLQELELAKLPVSQQLGLLRAYALVFERMGTVTKEQRAAAIATFDSCLPATDADVNAELLRVLVYLEAPVAAVKGMALIEANKSPAALDWGGVEKLNATYGATLKRLSENPPPTAAIHFAYMLRNLRKGWTIDLRRQYLTFLNLAAKADGGASYPLYLANIRDEFLATCSDAERIAMKDLSGESFNPVPDFPIEPPLGPGRSWTTAEAMDAVSSAGRVDFDRGRSLFHATTCGACHRFAGLGGGVGPDLTSVPNKFDTAYLVEAIIDPSKHISDQYQSSMVLLDSGRAITGLVVEQDSKTILVYPSDPAAKPEVVRRDEIETLRPSSLSQMPTGLLNNLNPAEVRDMIAYIMSGGNPEHKTYAGKRKKGTK